MAGINLKTEHFTNPIKLVLPGIIISLIGASAGYYLFNNPVKIRAKATFSTWQVVNQFETMLEKNADLLPCNMDSADQLLLKKDFVHLLEMTRQNMEDLKEEEKIDKRLAAILNLKIDGYNELKKITELFLDSARQINLNEINGKLTADKKTELISGLQADYMRDFNHISFRDTLLVKNILKELNQDYRSYVDSFKTQELVQTPAEIKKLVTGRWLTSDKVTIDFKKDSTGHWNQKEFESDFTWALKETVITIKFKGGNELSFDIYKISDQVVTFLFKDAKGNEIYANACKQ